jgi:RsiW-degrading membrane proteinase PrsW (M82 family)
VTDLYLHLPIALGPVLLLLLAFDRLDAFKLVSPATLGALLAIGAGMSALAYLSNDGVLDAFPIQFSTFTRLYAPIIEEVLKGLVVVALFAANRVGYLIDAAILGLAIGTGFAMAENAFFVVQFTQANLGVWIVRGFGTALMHGGATAVMATLSYLMFARRLRVSEDRYRFALWPFLPGLLAAIGIHIAFNQFQSQALLAMAVMIVLVPLALVLIFQAGERMAHHWLAHDSETHAQLVADLKSGAFARTRAGQDLQALATRLGESQGAALLDYVGLNAELVARADLTLLALEAHQHIRLGPSVADQFKRLHALERTLGPSTVHAVRQHLHLSRDDLWKLHELELDTKRHLDDRR